VAKLGNRIAVVTGAGRGIGLEYARRLASDGASVVIADIDEEAGETAAKGLAEAGYQVSHVSLDISSATACSGTVDRIVAERGRIDIVVNNAGLFREAGFAVAEEISLQKWEQMLDINISGTFYMCRAVIPHMKREGWGRIINQGSVSAYTTYPRSLHYSMSKAAISTMTKTLARELGPFGITVNAVAPGIIDTDATLEVMSSQVLKDAAERTSMGRIGHPKDLSPLVSFLCSDDASYITGQTIVVDGGGTMIG
jgi:NAD(P)-dependent dehydrogenase (short-subunit alcohol dehydrogenase family)